MVVEKCMAELAITLLVIVLILAVGLYVIEFGILYLTRSFKNFPCGVDVLIVNAVDD